MEILVKKILMVKSSFSKSPLAKQMAEERVKEIQNILDGKPTYPDVPDLEQAKTKPLPN